MMLAARQRAFFQALARADSTALEFMLPDFRVYDDRDSTFLDWESPYIDWDSARVDRIGPRFFPYSSVPPRLFPYSMESLRRLVARLGTDQLTAGRFEVRRQTDTYVPVITFRNTGPPSITGWIKRNGIWKASGTRINASEEALRFAGVVR